MQYTILQEGGGEGTVKYYTAQLADGFQWKSILSMLCTFIYMMGDFYGKMLWWFLALVVLDSITGILKSKHKGIPISSRRLRQAVNKLCAYMVLLTSLIVTSKVEPAFTPVVTASYYYFCFTEMKSILENVEEMGVHLPEFISVLIKSKGLAPHDESDHSEDNNN